MTGRVVFYGYRLCSTCRNALHWLSERGVEPAVRDLILDPLSREELLDLVRRAGGLDRLLSTKSPAYRARRQSTADDEWLAAMLDEGRLIRRPLLVVDNRIAVGFDPEAWTALLQDAST